ncbi:MAG: YlxR family protein [Actinomycetota bacterium]|nr:YlxR family protein [Actinomycetota bacterium]
MCVGCGRRAPQGELLRVVRLPDGSLAAGRTLPGRGAWLCEGSASCLDRAVRRGSLERALRAPLAPGSAGALAREIGKAGDVRGWMDTPAPRRDT